MERKVTIRRELAVRAWLGWGCCEAGELPSRCARGCGNRSGVDEADFE